jgi:formylglycine-generating enzyme required for sulfatase activity
MKECPTCRTCFPDDVSRCPDDGAETTPSISGEPILDGRYQLEKRLGSGGMGVVFKARHIFLKTQHAIKIILPDLVGNDPMLVTRFRQEALAAAAIRHQNIIAVTDFGVVRGTMPFLVMEFIHGKSLQEIMAEEGAMPPRRAFEIMQPICAGIAAAHRQKIIHRDLKPLNVMIQGAIPLSEGVKILDFGLAKIKSGELLGSFVAAQTTGLMGSPFYMAPEQWSDDPPDARADIYSLGVMFYQMLCAEVPFKGSSIPSIMKKHLTAEVPPLASKGARVAPQVETAVRHALEKEPKYRTASAEEFIDELRVAMAEATASAKRRIEPHLDTARTIVGSSVEGATTGEISPQTAFEPLAGTISGEALLEEELKTRFAQNELAREAQARRQHVEEGERKRKAEAEEKEEERQRLEEIVAKQTKVIEEKLSQLHASMARGTAVIDPDATQVQAGSSGVATVGNNSFPPGTAARSFPHIDVSLAPPAKKSWTAIVLVLAAIILIGGSAGGYFLLRSKLTPPAPVKPSTPAETPVKPDLAEIPGGTFQMGRNDGPPTEAPAHAVTVQTFFMDKTEVSNAEYALFVRDTNHAPPEHWGGIKPAVGDERLPVANVTYDDAVAFAAWRSKRDSVTYRLPTEEEWEYAARNGDKDNLYPWGNTWVAGRAATQEAGVGTVQPVGTYPQGIDAWGIQDLVGNVWEWTSSSASLYEGNPAKLPTQHKDWIVIRGGCYASPTKGDLPVSGTLRNWVVPNYKNPVLGFRLVRSGS